eukprot:gene17314-14749_t
MDANGIDRWIRVSIQFAVDAHRSPPPALRQWVWPEAAKPEGDGAWWGGDPPPPAPASLLPSPTRREAAAVVQLDGGGEVLVELPAPRR